ncbi:Sec-independent protein translocase subunit TatA [Streptomyces natalensis]|uniref:Sec-independent protein translocase protein TatA n=1 Tax=Streptomyces natalensis ATCC 27448 TaxID=1240678 RepID=A0A0D7CQI2_9ACTN|nr:Sec-independent protein translocase subunit TatA [Streptomyces natalensis]KIZ17677.1 preprotein translocase subunit TatA [Streptomyces natalensis ATCC 27448]
MFGGKIGVPELILIVVVLFLLFGAKKLPDMARSLGKSARILKSEAKAMKAEAQKEDAPADPPKDEADAERKTIKAAPGDVTSARPVADPEHTAQR